MVINDIYIYAQQRLQEMGITSYKLEAREICKFAIGLSDSEFHLALHREILDKNKRIILESIEKRANNEPLAYIIGEWDFYGFKMFLDNNILIPRADTELIVDVCRALLGNISDVALLDLCCGSGCIGTVLAKLIPCSGVTMADISNYALAFCRKNLDYHRVSGTYDIVKHNVFTDSLGSAKFNIIVSNPPYIPSRDIAMLDDDVKSEPHIALDGGSDGLDFYRAISHRYKDNIVKGGFMVFEVGIHQSDDVSTILEHEGYKNIKLYNDLCNIPRVVSAEKF